MNILSRIQQTLRQAQPSFSRYLVSLNYSKGIGNGSMENNDPAESDEEDENTQKRGVEKKSAKKGSGRKKIAIDATKIEDENAVADKWKIVDEGMFFKRKIGVIGAEPGRWWNKPSRRERRLKQGMQVTKKKN